MKAYRIARPDTAFSKSPVSLKKRPREHDDNHLKFIRGLSCIITGQRPCDPAHIRYPDPRYGKRETGKSEKPHDKFVVPLCREKHDEQHGMNEQEFWARHHIDPIPVALALWASTGDDEIAEVILSEARSNVRRESQSHDQ